MGKCTYLFPVAQTQNYTLVLDANTKRVLEYFLIFKIVNFEFFIYNIKGVSRPVKSQKANKIFWHKTPHILLSQMAIRYIYNFRNISVHKHIHIKKILRIYTSSKDEETVIDSFIFRIIAFYFFLN